MKVRKSELSKLEQRAFRKNRRSAELGYFTEGYTEFLNNLHNTPEGVVEKKGYTLEPPYPPIEYYALHYPLIVSPFLFGIRVIFHKGKLCCLGMPREDRRTYKPIPVTNRHILERLGSVDSMSNFIGIVTVGKPSRENRSKLIKQYLTSNKPLPSDFKINLVDIRQPKMAFIERAEFIDNYDDGLFVGLKHKMVYSKEELIKEEKGYIEQGYGGIMLHVPYGRFYSGRVSFLRPIIFHRKLPKVDIGTIYCYNNEVDELGLRTGRMSSLMLKYKTDKSSRKRWVTGMDDATKRYLYKIRHQLIGRKVLFCYWIYEGRHVNSLRLLKLLKD